MSSELSLEEAARIDEALKNFAKTSQGISPSNVAEETRIELRKVIKGLNDLAVAGKVSATYEIDCPNCDRSVKRTDEKNHI